jgi:predicted small secreted protein
VPGFLFLDAGEAVDRSRRGAIYLRALPFRPIPEEIFMTRFAVAIVLTSLLALSSCANTANGLAKDGRQMGNAVDDSTHRVLKAGQN